MPDDDIQEPSAPHSEPAASSVAPEQTFVPTPTPEPEPNSQPPPVSRAAQPQYAPPQAVATVPPALVPTAAPPPPPPPPKPPADDDEDDDEDDDPEERGMLRMSFMEHLEELRSVILRSIAGILVAFF